MAIVSGPIFVNTLFAYFQGERAVVVMKRLKMTRNRTTNRPETKCLLVIMSPRKAIMMTATVILSLTKQTGVLGISYCAEWGLARWPTELG